MPLPPVVVEIAPPESPAPLRTLLLDACSRASEGAICIEPGTPHDVEPVVVATVTWKDASNAEVRVAMKLDPKWLVRDIPFGERDPPEERWRAVGLVVGTLATVIAPHDPLGTAGAPPPPSEGASTEEAPEAPPVFEAEPPEPDAAGPPILPPNASASAVERRGSLDASAILGSALDRGPVRVGAELEGRLGLAGSGFFVTAAFAYSQSAHRLSGARTTWVDAFAGLAFGRELGGRFASTVHAEGFCEQFATDVDIGGDATPKSGGRILGGAQLGADLTWWAAKPIGFFAGGSGRWTAGTTTVRVGGADIGTMPLLGYVVQLGATYEF